MRLPLLLVLALLPGLGLLAYFYGRDRHQPEPGRLVWGIFFFGALGVIPAGLAEVGLTALTGWQEDSSQFWKVGLHAFLIVGFIEELCKFWALSKIYARPEFDEAIDGLVYGAAAGAGFATMENLFYVLEHGFGVGIIRALLSVPVHVLLAMVMGYGLAKQKLVPNPWAGPAALAAAAFGHGLYDLVLFVQDPANPGSSALISIGVVLALLFWVGRTVDHAGEQSRLALLTELGLPPEAQAAASPAEAASFASWPRIIYLFFGAGALLWAVFLSLGYTVLYFEGTVYEGWIYALTAGGPAFAGAAALRKAAQS